MIPKRVQTRISSQLKRYAPILSRARDRDINEADTVAVVRDLLRDLFGYRKYTEITTEYAIRRTYCDLAVKIDDNVKLLIETKAIGQELRHTHLRQVTNYAANSGVEWVAVTNGFLWQVYHVKFGKPIETEKVFEVDLIEADPSDEQVQEHLHLLSREGMRKSAIEGFHHRQQATSRYVLAAALLTEPVLRSLARETRLVTGGVKRGVRLKPEELKRKLSDEVLKREVITGEKADAARKMVRSAAGHIIKQKRKAPQKAKLEPEDTGPPAPPTFT